ncbi:hypothetical protein AFK69_19435 [Xenorhabdus sp. GDc328]|nr:hypothetical protein AAY47_12090 [Xenorhabdus griffiniae]KOP31728.1 hypothetical protein AFK69_19435 [Xenorhabdus sp. GDc328]
MSTLTDSAKEKLTRLLANNGLLVIRQCDLSPDQLIAFSRIFGEVVAYTRSSFSLPSHPDILILSNIEANGKTIGSPVSGRVWHLDGHYLEKIPACTVLNMKTLQRAGGDTWFANMQLAYDQLTPEIKEKISELKVVISRVQSRPYNYPDRGEATPEERAAWPDVTHPVVLEHPETGKKALAVGSNVPWKIVGQDKYSATALITFLQEWVRRERFTYRHVWREGDLLIWDNRVVMHKASPYQGARMLYRTTTF